MSAEGPKRPVLYWVICSAPPALDWPRPLGLLHEAGQDVCVILTPTAAAWLDIGQLEEATGHAVRTRPRLPTQQDDPQGRDQTQRGACSGRQTPPN